jgi:hypothetical protein
MIPTSFVEKRARRLTTTERTVGAPIGGIVDVGDRSPSRAAVPLNRANRRRIVSAVTRKSPLVPASIVVVSKDQLASSIGGETVILGLSAGRYYGVDGVSARVWQLVQQPIRVAEVRDVIVKEYEVDPATCEADIIRLLGQMIDAGLIEVQAATAP